MGAALVLVGWDTERAATGPMPPQPRSAQKLEVGSDTPHMLTLYIGLLDVDFDIIDAPGFAVHLRTMAGRFELVART
ncbi:hypothetical protein [Antrihabitans stalactiti]|uniref:Uncharacterized protein n=1 Tax=Antrihabitans stalactiti TaxID=2584121 RepID=A0A848KJ88_9NOCA|nr:hypothetical protein [Antrihabitans stalactiti]NMN96742.1 hypothetical protein [Antrihabitans stalactiti]